MPSSLGAVALRDFIAPDDAPYTRAIADAGLISIARSSMPELGLNVVTESPLVGPTRNPWSLEHTRSEERRVGKACGSTCRSRRAPYYIKNKQHTKEQQKNTSHRIYQT